VETVDVMELIYCKIVMRYYIPHIQRLKAQGKTASIEWVQGHNNDPGNDRADELAGQATEQQPSRLANAVSIAWKRKIVSEQYTAVANIEFRAKGKFTITPPPPKKSALEKGPNSEARAIAQLRTNHWLSGVYLKRIKKDHMMGVGSVSHHTTHKIPLE
jgi:hypothetical protein